jgi:hypothetical protein
MFHTDDPVVEELHRIREEMLEHFGGLEGLVRHLREIQAGMPERIVSCPPKAPIGTKEIL